MKKSFSAYITKNWLSASLVTGIDTFIQISDKEEFELSIEPIKNKRSAAQNRLYWLILDMCVDAGKAFTRFEKWQKEHYHEAAKDTFLRSIDEVIKKPITRSTTDLTVEEMSKYIDNVIDIILVKTLCGTFAKEYKDLYRQSWED